MFTKQQILDELTRVADELGRSPGKKKFLDETGIKESDWSGIYWARWSDALAEAGLSANSLQGRTSDDDLSLALADETRRLGRFPTFMELRLRARQESKFPGHVLARHRGTKAALARMLVDYCQRDPDAYADVIALATAVAESGDVDDADAGRVRRDDAVLGHVYLLKLGKHYKIGRSNAFGRRERELAIQMPERATTVHVINTDDPVGIEAYWHQRFADKRVRQDAEWFALSVEDVRVFKRRRFQ